MKKVFELQGVHFLPLLRGGCTAMGINNAEGCCVSDRVGTEYRKGGV